MQKIVFSVVLSCTLAISSGCSQQPKMSQQGIQGKNTKLAIERETDNRMADWDLTSKDAELYIGDLGVDQRLAPSNQVKSLETGSSIQMLSPNNSPLIPAFPDPSIVPIQGSYVENVIQMAENFMGTPYEYGSDRSDPSTFDCSDFTHYAFLSALGMNLPNDSKKQAAYVETLSKRKYTDISKAQRGDLLFFSNYRGNKPSDYEGLDASQRTISHTGIYLGDGKIIHTASQKTGGVRIDQIFDKHLQYRFVIGGGVLD
jgi:cell wall-associated NlpC family hydrolase